ncbi:MAG: hypothetical protein Q9179_007837, partial [Wetmoreana sp. 5 TL-2023]
YAEGLDLVLRDQNQVAKAGAERRQKARGKNRTQSPDSSSGTASPQPLTVYTPLAESQDSYAHTFFVSAYVLAPRDSRTDHGFIELLPFFFDKLKSSLVLSLSLSVVAHCYFRAWQPAIRNIDHLIVQKKYAKALKALQLALQDPRHCASDETLMAVCLLSFYEYTVSAILSRPRAEQHVDGISALVKRRGSKTMNSELSKRLLIAARHSIVSKSIANSMPVDGTLEIWDDPEQMPNNPATLLDGICLEAANVLAAAANNKSACEMHALYDETVSAILFRAEAVEAKFAAWPTHVPIEWWPIPLPRELIPREILVAGFHGDYCDMYPDTSVCATWNNFRTVRLRILCLIADYDSTESKFKTVLRIRAIADDILVSLPFMLGSKSEAAGMYDTDFVYPSCPGQSVSMSHYQTAAAFGGLTLYVPLTAIFAFTRYLRGDQIQFATQQLRRLGVLYDVRNSHERFHRT